MISKLITFSLIFSLTLCTLQNINNTCENLKKLLFKNIKVFYGMEENERNQTYIFSLRGIVHTFLGATTFTDSQLEGKKNQILSTIKQKEDAYYGIMGYDQTEVASIAENLAYAHQNMVGTHKDLYLTWYEYNTKIDTYKQNLIQLREQMIQANPEIENKTNLLKDLNKIIPLIDTIDSNSEIMLTILDDIKVLLGENYPQTMQYIKTFADQLGDFLKLDELLSTNENIQENFALSYVDQVESELSKLKNKKDIMIKLLDASKSTLKNDLNKLIETLKVEIKAIPNYDKFVAMMNETKILQAKTVSMEGQEKEANELLNVKTWSMDTANYLRRRIHPKHMSELQRKLLNLSQLLETRPETFSDGLVNDETSRVNLKKYFTDNNSRISEIQAEYEMVTEKLGHLDDLRKDEAELDKLFALALAFLQGGTQSDLHNNKCFSMLELSVYFYYLGLYQVIISRKNFYLTFMDNVTEDYRTNLIKNLFRDLQGHQLKDKDIISVYTRKLVQDGLMNSAYKYVFLMNSEIEDVYQHQITYKVDEEGTWFASIMSVAGYTKDFVLDVIKKGTWALIIAALTTALLAFLSLQLGFLAVAFVSAFLSVVLGLFFTWAGEKIKANPQIKETFMGAIAKIYSMFSPTKIEYLDIDESLKEVTDKELSTKVHEKQADNGETNKLNYFKNKFDKLP